MQYTTRKLITLFTWLKVETFLQIFLSFLPHRGLPIKNANAVSYFNCIHLLYLVQFKILKQFLSS